MHHEELKGDEASKVKGQLKSSTGSVPEDIRVGDFLNKDASNTEHGPPGVNALGLSKPERAWEWIALVLILV